MFLGFLYLPTLIFPFVKNLLPEDDSEKRQLATFPKLENAGDLVQFPVKFDQYWSDNLPFRGSIQQIYSDVNFLLFRVPVASRVIAGKNDGNWRHTWLFYNEIRDGDPIGNLKGAHDVSELAMRRYLARMRENTNMVKTQYGADLYYIVAPNKSTVYQEYLPTSLGTVTDCTPARKMHQYFKDNGMKNYLFLEDAIREEKEKNQLTGLDYPLYYLLDTHWNQYGAFIGAKATLGLVEPRFSGYDKYRVFSEGYTIKTGDLKKFTNLNLDLLDQNVKVETNIKSVIAHLTKPDGAEVITNNRPLIDKTLLMVGDSYRTLLIPWLANVYKKVIHVHRNTYNHKMLEEYKADIVILEAVERYVTVNVEFLL